MKQDLFSKRIWWLNHIKGMKKKIFPRYVFVGVLNTLFGTVIMFVLYNVFNLSYWMSSAANYFFGSILSYILNKYITFKYAGWDIMSMVKFILNILVCYVIAYSLAKPIIRYLLDNANERLSDNIAMFLGMCVFVLLNYIGQRYIVFKR